MITTQTIKLTKIKEAVFAVAFTALAVYVPVLLHYFGGADAGRKFLPMPFFVILAGLLLGWRAGLVAGIASPIISYLVSGMPVANILPFVTVQLCLYGFMAGILKMRFSAWISIAGALLSGLLAGGISVFLFSKMSATAFTLSAARDGWIGMAIQLLFLPLIMFFLQKYLSDEKSI
ncbi:MAG: ECF transporter S component [Parcubacteria group bacterium]|jgi:hypothetical protein